MRGASTSEDRKKLIKERAATMPSDAETRKKLASSYAVATNARRRHAPAPKHTPTASVFLLLYPMPCYCALCSSRSGYLKMYKAYCAQPTQDNPDVCTHPTLKKLFTMYEKGAGGATTH